MPKATRGTIWWDFDGTLVNRPFMWTEVAMRLLDRHHAEHSVSPAALTNALSTGMPWHRLDHAHPELTTSALWWTDVYRRYIEVFTAFGCPSATAPDVLAEIRADILNASRYTVFDDVVPALRRATERGWGHMIVSNHVPELADIVSGLGLRAFFQTIVTSGMVGYEKPHRRLFEAALRHVPPGTPVWMIGDNVDADCLPVCSLGMKAVLVRHAAIPAFEHEARDLLSALDIIDVD